MSLNSLSTEELLVELRKNYYLKDGKFSLEYRVNACSNLMKYLGFTVNNEQLAYIVSNYRRIITEACAGSGKSVSSLVKAFTHIMFGDVRPGKVLLLSYTKESSLDLQRKADLMFNKLSKIRDTELVISRDIEIVTIGAFFNELVYEYPEECGIAVINNRLKIASEDDCIAYFRSIVFGMVESNMISISPYDSLYSSLHSLYVQIIEKAVFDDKAAWERCTNFKTLRDIPLDDLEKIFKMYDSYKRSIKCIELSELARMSYKLLQNPEILERWKARYDLILVDEYQDITESQSLILKQLVDVHSPAFLFAIGDSDQSIYGFRGAHVNGCYNFAEEFGSEEYKAVRCFMSLNRRCPATVLTSASKVIETLNTRIPKKLESLKPGGQVSIFKVENSAEEAEEVLEYLKELRDDELQDTVVAYRSNRSARFLRRYLENHGYRINARTPISDLFETSLVGAVSLLADPYDTEVIRKNLYKVIPKSKDFGKREIEQIVKAEEESRKRFHGNKSFFELDYSKYNTPSDFKGVITTLCSMSLCLRGQMQDKYAHLQYMDKIVSALVFNFLRKYYLEWQDMKMDTEGSEHIFSKNEQAFEDYYCADIYKYYTQHITWAEFQRVEATRKQALANTAKSVIFSTFHSLKGLEFSHVLLIDLRDNVFPGYELEEAAKFGSYYVKEADDEAKRLFYVAMTRSKSNLAMYFSKNNPTRYVSYLVDDGVQSDSNTTGDMFDFSMMDTTTEEQVSLSAQEPRQSVDPAPFDLDETGDDTQEPEQTTTAKFSRDTVLGRWLK